MICAISIETGIAPSLLYAQEPIDLATMMSLLEERARG